MAIKNGQIQVRNEKVSYDKKILKALNSQFFRRLLFEAEDSYEVKLVKSTTKYREPLIMEFLILHYANVRFF